jgi:hypothetical protein
MNLSDDEIVSLGLFCENLMQQDLFQVLVNVIEQQTFAEFATTKPHEKNAREAVYARFDAFRGFLGTMGELARHAQGILEQHNAPSDLDEQ